MRRVCVVACLRPVIVQRRHYAKIKYSATSDANLVSSNDVGPWKQLRSHREFFDSLEQQLGITTKSQWYEITTKQIENMGGSGLLSNYYSRSLQQALETIYPDHKWVPWLFRKVPRSFWSHKHNHRLYFDWLEKQLQISDKSLWYTKSIKDIKALSAMGLLWRFYNNSLVLALLEIYPQHDWKIFQFEHVPKGFWRRHEAQRKLLDWMFIQMQFKSMNDWYSVSNDDFKRHQTWSLVRQYYNESIPTALQSIYPTHVWEPFLFQKLRQVPKERETTQETSASGSTVNRHDSQT